MENWVRKLEQIFTRMCWDKVLVTIRAITILIWIFAMWSSLELKIEIQLFFVVVIFLSDAFDGMYSRRYTHPKQQYWFRIIDSTVDKLGILFFMVTLFDLERIKVCNLFIIIGYNFLLIIFPVVYIFGKSLKNVDKIQATMWSRFYAVSVGLFCFGAAISNIAIKYSFLWTIYFSVLGIISVFSHINKLKKIKGEY